MGKRIMKSNVVWLGVLLLAATTATADDLSGADGLLCASSQAIACNEEEGCQIAPPWVWNIPSFVEVDLAKKTIGTTAASGEDRITPIRTIEKTDGQIFLQGIEGGRAFSFIIEEASGFLTVAVARDGFTVSVFGACTPIPEAGR
jgi:hypothetical protein